MRLSLLNLNDMGTVIGKHVVNFVGTFLITLLCSTNLWGFGFYVELQVAESKNAERHIVELQIVKVTKCRRILLFITSFLS
jgi:hypothetical protein